MQNKLKSNFGVDYLVDYRDIKYPRLEFKTGNLLLVLPAGYADETKLIESHNKWIKVRNSQILDALKLSEEIDLNTKRTEDQLKGFVNEIAKANIDELQLALKNIIFKPMKSKWASCSSKGNLTVNLLLKYLPEDLIKYVIYHEITHLKEKRHNSRFWKMIEEKFKDYQEKEKQLFVYWFSIQNRSR